MAYLLTTGYDNAHEFEGAFPTLEQALDHVRRELLCGEKPPAGHDTDEDVIETLRTDDEPGCCYWAESDGWGGTTWISIIDDRIVNVGEMAVD